MITFLGFCLLVFFIYLIAKDVIKDERKAEIRRKNLEAEMLKDKWYH